MKKVKGILFICILFIMVSGFTFSTKANAANWKFATVKICGIMNNGAAYLVLTSTSWTGPRYFTILASVKNQILATALTAVSLGQQVYACFESDTWADWSTVSGLALYNQN